MKSSFVSIMSVIDKGYQVTEFNLGPHPIFLDSKLVVPYVDTANFNLRMIPLAIVEHNDDVFLNIANYEPEAWKICSRTKQTLDKNGQWVYEPLPSERTDEFIQSTRWTTAFNALEFYESWKLKVVTDFIKEHNLPITVEQVYGTYVAIET